MKIESADGKSIEHAQEFTHYSTQVRIRRTINGFCIGLGLALCSLPIPGLHFFLVPGFLIFAFYSAYSRFNESYFINLIGSKCPNCTSLLSEKALHLKSLPGRLYCYECRTQLRILQ